MDEVTVGTGAACGSIYLNQQFESFLRNRLGEKVMRNLPEKRLKEVIAQFDSTIKREFNPLDPTSEKEFEISIPLPDMPEKGLSDGYLSVSKYAMNQSGD